MDEYFDYSEPEVRDVDGDLTRASKEAARRILQRDGITGRVWDCDTYDKFMVYDIILPEFPTKEQFEEYLTATVGERGMPEPAPDATGGRIIGPSDILANLAYNSGHGYEMVILRSAEHPDVNSEWAQELLDVMEPVATTSRDSEGAGYSLQYSICASLAGNHSVGSCLLANVLAINTPTIFGSILAHNPNLNGTSIDKITKSYLAPCGDSLSDSLVSFSLNWETTLSKLFNHQNARLDTKIMLAQEIVAQREALKSLRDKRSKVEYMLPAGFEESIVSALASLMLNPVSREHFTETQISEVFVWLAAH